MALPEITFNADTGSDTAASGSAPSTAVSGTVARCRTTSPTRVGFWEGSPPDLSGVPTDGSGALWFDTTAGRKWSKITAKKDTQQSTTGTTSGGSAVITAIGTTAGMSNGDAIRIQDGVSPGTPLYSEILTVDSGTQITLRDNVTNGGAGKSLVDPKQITPQDTYTAPASDRNWGIGGKRQLLTLATQLWPDLHAGWTVSLEVPPSGATYATAASFTLTVAGDTTDGRIVIRGIPVGTTKPRILGANTATSIVQVQQALYTFRDLAFDRCDSAMVVNNVNGTDLLVHRCEFTEIVSTITTGIAHTSTGRMIVSECDFRDAATGISMTGNCIAVIEKTFIRGATTAISITSEPTLIIDRTILQGSTTGLSLATSTNPSLISIQRTTFDTCTTAVNASNINRARCLIFRSTLMRNCANGITFAANSNLVQAIVDQHDDDGMGGWTGIVFTTYGITDPRFRDQANYDFRPQGSAVRSYVYDAGPTYPWGDKIGGTPSLGYTVPGAVQPADSVGGIHRAEILSATDDGTHVVIGYRSMDPGGGWHYRDIRVEKLTTSSDDGYEQALVSAIVAAVAAGAPAASNAALLVGAEATI